MLLGLKENVIIGKLIPAGTGMEYYHDEEKEEGDDSFEEEEPINIGYRLEATAGGN
jgi:hypothetical protein